MLEWVKQLAIYAVLIGVVYAGAVYIPKMLSKVAVGEQYSEIDGIDMTSDFPLDPTVRVGQLKPGDGIAWNLPEQSGSEVGLGWFAGGPGDLVEIDHVGALLVNGTKLEKPGLIPAPACKLVIPEHHFFAVTHQHQLDSIKLGPLHVDTLRGRVKGPP